MAFFVFFETSDQLAEVGQCLPSLNWMEAVPQKMLKVVPEPMVILAAVSVPPVLEDRGSPTVEYVCGGCGAVLMRADEQVHTLIIHCTACDAYNSTDD